MGGIHRYRLRRDTKPGVVCHHDALVVFGEDAVALFPVSRNKGSG